MHRAARWSALLFVLAIALPAPAESTPRFRPYRDDVFYMYMPIAWRDSDGDSVRFGDFGGMTASIPYLESLGVTAVWMTPIFVSPAYHGYQHGRADSLNARFGTEQQFWSFVKAAHADSIKVLIDFVAYGISQDSPWFHDSYGNPASVYDDWLAYTNAGNTQYLGSTYPTWNGDTVGFIHWDLRNPQVTRMVTDWAIHWLDPNGDGNPADGIDGFRLDHVSASNPDESPWGYDLAWWVAWKARLAAVNPDVFTVAEQADWGYGYELFDAHDAVFTKPFEDAARHGLSIGDARPIASSMDITSVLVPPGKLLLATLGDHDVGRLATSLGDDTGRLRAAAAVLMLQPFPPVIYFGDELGMRGAKREDFTGDAKDIPFREPFKWNAEAGPPMSNYLALNAQAYAERVSRDHDGRSVEEQSGVPGSLLEHYRRLAALRHAHPGLRRGDYYGVGSPDTTTWAFLDVAPEETLLVIVNVGSPPGGTALDLSAFIGQPADAPVTDVETGAKLADISAANRAAYPVAVGAYGYRVLRTSVAPRDLRALFADANLVLTQDSPSLVIDHVFELDQMFVRFDPAGLSLGITGNLIEGGHSLILFFDAGTGGQNVLQTASLPQPPTSLPSLSGMAFDTGFEPEVALAINNFSGRTYVDYYRLATGGGGTKRYVGSTPIGVEGPLSGGDNPSGIEVAYSPNNRRGIAPGTALGAATATDGFQILIPWADLGLPNAGPALRLMAMLALSDGYTFNQFLPGLQGFYGALGYAPFSLADIPGEQFATLGNTTQTEASLISARSLGGSVEIVWHVARRDAFDVERSTRAGAWILLARVVPDGAGFVRAADGDVEPGLRYGYRLVMPGDPARVLSETWIDVPRHARLALHAVSPNPSSGPLRLSLELTGVAPASLAVYDVHGRRVLEREVGSLGAGAHTLDLGRDPLAPGLYLVQLREAGETRRQRVVVIR